MGPRALGTLVAAALTLPTASAASLPTHGVFVPGESLGGIRLGDTKNEVLDVWGSRHGVCRDCRRVTWYFNLKPFEPQGAAVVFRRGRVVRSFTVWRPRGWRTDEGLELGATSGALAKAYPGLASRACDRYTAFLQARTVRTTIRTTSVFYVYRGRLWGFGLMRPRRSPCL